jgi:hypothetical protein
MGCAELFVETTWFPKGCICDKVTCGGTMAVPESETICGLSEALSTMLS